MQYNLFVLIYFLLVQNVEKSLYRLNQYLYLDFLLDKSKHPNSKRKNLLKMANRQILHWNFRVKQF